MFCVRQFGLPDVDALLTGGDPSQNAAALTARFSRGDRAFGAIDSAGRVCHVRWVSAARVHIPEIDRDIVPAPRQAYFYNGYTRPDVRRRGVDRQVRRFIFDTLRGEGFDSVCSYARLDNPAALRAAARYQQPIGTIRYVALRGTLPIAWRTDGQLPTLAPPVSGAPDGRADVWRTWFTSWVREPLSKRSTGCAALDERSFRSTAQFIVEALTLSPDADSLLDVGCDSTMVTRFVAPHSRRVMGIDLIHDMLSDSRRVDVGDARGGRPWLVTADACRLPIRSGAFSKVYSSAMLHTLPTREHGMRVIEELIRVTAGGGTVLVTSVPDTSKRYASRLDIWRRSHPLEKLTLPVRWLVPRAIKRAARGAIARPASGLPEFLDYDLAGIAASLRARGFRSEVRDFPADYWSGEFRTSRSNLLIFIPGSAAANAT
jgi:ubiquinone/menaquinone biosynthesis C-methylase UbiE